MPNPIWITWFGVVVIIVQSESNAASESCGRKQRRCDHNERRSRYRLLDPLRSRGRVLKLRSSQQNQPCVGLAGNPERLMVQWYPRVKRFFGCPMGKADSINFIDQRLLG